MPQDYTVHHVETLTHGRVLVKAAGPDVLIGFHGYAEAADVQFDRLRSIPASDGWTLVSVQGLNRFYRGRTEDVVAGWMTRQDRDTAIIDNVAYVDRVVESLRQTRREGRIVFIGFSQGTAMAFRAAVRGRIAANGVAAVGGDVPPELLSDNGANFPPVFLSRGARDEWYTKSKLDSDLEALVARGARVTPLTYDGGHEWTPEVSNAVGSFLRSL